MTLIGRALIKLELINGKALARSVDCYLTGMITEMDKIGEKVRTVASTPETIGVSQINRRSERNAERYLESY